MFRTGRRVDGKKNGSAANVFFHSRSDYFFAKLMDVKNYIKKKKIITLFVDNFYKFEFFGELKL